MTDRLPGPMIDPLPMPAEADVRAFERVVLALAKKNVVSEHFSGVVITYLPECAGMPAQWGASISREDPVYGATIDAVLASLIRSSE